MQNPILKIIEEKGWCVADGAIGSNLFHRGLVAGCPPELWCIENPLAVCELHQEFLNAGSDIILTNSFGANACRLKLHSSEHRVTEINILAAELANKVATDFFNQTGRTTVIAGAMGPTGELFAPMGSLHNNDAVEIFSEQAEALARGGVDVLWIETMSCNRELIAAAQAAKSVGLPVCGTLTFDTARCSMMGVSPTDFAHLAEDIGLDMMGANCGIGPAELLDSLAELMTVDNSIPIVVKSNCGIPQFSEGSIHYPGNPQLMAQYALFARDLGAKIIGGCCGTTPDHLEAIVTALDRTPPRSFDRESMLRQLGSPWKNQPSSEIRDNDRMSHKRARKRRRKRRHEVAD